jgi:hypothetical protein
MRARYRWLWNLDLWLFYAGGAATMILIAATILFPIYSMVDGTYARRPLWNPPQFPIGHGYDLLNPEDIARLSQDPRQFELLEKMRTAPRFYAGRPIFIGSRKGQDSNALGWLALYASLLYFGWLITNYRP